MQAVAAFAGSLLLLRAGSNLGAPFAFAQDEEVADDDDSGRGRDQGRGDDDDRDNSGPGNADDRADDAAQLVEVPRVSLEVRIVGDDAGDFVPGELTVDAGQSVTFINTHSDEHTATGSGFDTGIIPEGGIVTVVLDTPGSFPYACLIHPEMTGVILVRGVDGTVPRQSEQASPAALGDSPAVRIANLAFNPAEIIVTTGTTVVWTNDDAAPHTVTSLDGVFDSGIFDPGTSFSWTFGQPGTFPYQCLLHPQMQGTVVVEGVWIVQVAPDDTSLLGTQAALWTLHADGMVAASFGATGADAPRFSLDSGHGAWVAKGESFGIVLVALAKDGAQRVTGTVTIDARGQIDSSGVLSGAFAFAISSASGATLGDGPGTFRGEWFVGEPGMPTPSVGVFIAGTSTRATLVMTFHH